jgi:hypothetical protein
MAGAAAGAGMGIASQSAIFTVIIVAVILAARLVRAIKGTRVSRNRLIAFSAVLVGFSAFVTASSFFAAGIPVLYTIPYAGVFAASANVGHRLSKNSLFFWKASDGSIFVKGGLFIMAIYFGALIARLTINILFGGPFSSEFAFSPSLSPTSSLSSTHVDGARYWASVVTDLLLMLGAGLFTGRNIMVLRRYAAIRSGRESVEAA